MYTMMTKVFCQFSIKCSLKYFVQIFDGKMLQKDVLCIILCTVLKYLKVPTTDCLAFFSEYISRTAILTQASVITCKSIFYCIDVTCLTFIISFFKD